MKKKLNHTIPKSILRYFKNENKKLNLNYLTKSGVIGDKNITKRNFVNIKNFYSKKSLNELLKSNKHIQINPIFKFLDEDLETNIDRCVENPFSKIIKIILGSPIKFDLNEKEEMLIKEYLCIQHMRTKRFKEDSKKIRLNSEIPDLDEISKQILKKTEEFVMDPKLLEKYKSKAKIEAIKVVLNIREHLNKSDTHSLDIINKVERDSFFKTVGLEKKNVSLVLNNTSIPFVLPDCGSIIGSHHPTIKSDTLYEAYIPITPKIMLRFSNKPEKIVHVDDETIIESLNDLFYEESFEVIFCNNKSYLDSIKRSREY